MEEEGRGKGRKERKQLEIKEKKDRRGKGRGKEMLRYSFLLCPFLFHCSLPAIQAEGTHAVGGGAGEGDWHHAAVADGLLEKAPPSYFFVPLQTYFRITCVRTDREQ